MEAFNRGFVAAWLVVFGVLIVLSVGGCKASSTHNDSGDDGGAVPGDDSGEAHQLSDTTAEALDQSILYLMENQSPEGFWMGSFVTDTSFTADYILLSHYLDRVDETRQAKAVRYILSRQQADGGWNAYPGGPSSLDISVVDYLALKLAGVSAQDASMLAARLFILSNGGAEKSNTLIKTRLALFGQAPWSEMLPFNTARARFSRRPTS